MCFSAKTKLRKTCIQRGGLFMAFLQESEWMFLNEIAYNVSFIYSFDEGLLHLNELLISIAKFHKFKNILQKDILSLLLYIVFISIIDGIST